MIKVIKTKTMVRYACIIIILLPNLSSAQWTTNGNDAVNTNTGNVGIGTTNPTSKLQIHGNGATALSIIENPASSVGAHFTSEGANNIMFQLKATANGAINTELRTAGNSYLNALFGNVGIGTTTPIAKLHVEGDTYVGTNPIKFLGASTGINKIQSFAGNVFGTWEFKSQFDNIILDAGANANNLRKIIFKIGGSDKMLIAENGNVGIGTTNPDSKLAVNGTIHAKEVRVDLSGWPDYVFEPTYNLKPLSEIEAYIKENKHLPEVPAASEVEKNGLQLGEMNKLLMRKVEELTLHMIEQQKMIETQNREIEKLKILIK